VRTVFDLVGRTGPILQFCSGFLYIRSRLLVLEIVCQLREASTSLGSENVPQEVVSRISVHRWRLKCKAAVVVFEAAYEVSCRQPKAAATDIVQSNGGVPQYLAGHFSGELKFHQFLTTSHPLAEAPAVLKVGQQASLK